MKHILRSSLVRVQFSYLLHRALTWELQKNVELAPFQQNRAFPDLIFIVFLILLLVLNVDLGFFRYLQRS